MPEPAALTGKHVKLLPLEPSHIDPLVRAARERSTYAFTMVPDGQMAMEAYVDEACARRDDGTQEPFVITRTDTGEVIGSTRFLSLEYWPDEGEHRQDAQPPPTVAEIGATWMATTAQRGPWNTEAKLLMGTHAFETWGCRRVRLCTDARNWRSRRAIARIGAHFDGVLRCDRPAADHTLRDTASFSILAEEWPTVRGRLRHRLEHQSWPEPGPHLGQRLMVCTDTDGPGDVDPATRFVYTELADGAIHGEYRGGQIRLGFLVGQRMADHLDFRYAHLTTDGTTSTGHCRTRISLDPEGNARFDESWEWESHEGSGTSTVVEWGW